MTDPETQQPTAETPADDAPIQEEQPTVATQTDHSDLQTQLQQYQDLWMRERADFANYKRRAERDRREAYQDATGDTWQAILPVVDDFERAMAHLPPTLTEDAWVGGVSLILRKLNKALDDAGITRIDPTGGLFDPDKHQAVASDDADGVESGTVIETLQKGYLLGDRVLRPAMVRVAR